MLTISKFDVTTKAPHTCGSWQIFEHSSVLYNTAVLITTLLIGLSQLPRDWVNVDGLWTKNNENR